MRGLRRVSLLLSLSAVVVLSASGRQPASAIPWRAIAPGVEYAQFSRTTDATGAAAGPWSVQVIRAHPGQARLDVVHALDAAVGLETTSSMAERHDAVAAINGGYFRTAGTFRGDSTGTLMIDGALLSEPDRSRAAVGFIRQGASTRFAFGHVDWTGTLRAGRITRPLDGINRARGANEVVLFTPRFHHTTLTDARGDEIVVRSGRVSAVRTAAGSTTIPSDGFVLSVTGTAREWARSALRPGTRVSVTTAIHSADPSPQNPWRAAEDVLGAGPKLVTGGKVDVTDGREKMTPNFATDRHPRTAIGALADGRALLLVVDGRQPSLSIGMTLDEFARQLIELGVVEGINLDGGGSTTMVIEGKVVNSPSDPTGERPVSDAIVVRRIGPR